MDHYRRSFLLSSAAIAAVLLSKQAQSSESPEDAQKQAFIRRVNQQSRAEFDKFRAEAEKMQKQGIYASLSPPQELKPFKDWDYYYLKGMGSSWIPNPGIKYKRVDVPVGFVTDLASVPQWAWSSGVRPEGAYAYAAVIHDYLYWTQQRPKAEADAIFLFAMEDSRVQKGLREKIYLAVKKFGGSAWTNNAKLKAMGERRILKDFPDDFTISWQDWKRRPGVFAD